jgi:ComF family protein
LKYGGCYGLGVAMGRELGAALAMFREFEAIDLVVPVPLHRARRRERGYNQAEAIGEGIASTLGGARMADALERSRHTRSQTTLDAVARGRNVGGMFRPNGPIARGRTVLLCDDVCTTGATLNACATALLDAGAARVLAATVAKDLPARTGTSRVS